MIAPSLERAEQCAEFLVYVSRISQRAGDLFSQELTVPLAQPVNGHPYRGFPPASGVPHRGHFPESGILRSDVISFMPNPEAKASERYNKVVSKTYPDATTGTSTDQ